MAADPVAQYDFTAVADAIEHLIRTGYTFDSAAKTPSQVIEVHRIEDAPTTDDDST